MNTQKELLSIFKNSYSYLDIDSFDENCGEVELKNGAFEKALYFQMFNEFIQPKVSEMLNSEYKENEVIFNYFICESGKIYLSFYEPEVDFKIRYGEHSDIIIDKGGVGNE